MVPVEACCDNSLIRIRIETSSLIAPSTILRRDIPSFRLRTPCLKVLTSDLRATEVIRPAESSELFWILCPEDIREKTWLSLLLFSPNKRWAEYETRLLKIRRANVLIPP